MIKLQTYSRFKGRIILDTVIIKIKVLKLIKIICYNNEERINNQVSTNCIKRITKKKSFQRFDPFLVWDTNIHITLHSSFVLKIALEVIISSSSFYVRSAAYILLTFFSQFLQWFFWWSCSLTFSHLVFLLLVCFHPF